MNKDEQLHLEDYEVVSNEEENSSYHNVSLDEIAAQRNVAYEKLSEFATNRTSYYRDPTKLNLKKLLAKDVVMFAARGVQTAEEFVEEAFRACESSSEETVMGNTWQAIITAISSDTLDTGDMMTVRDGALYVCELKSQTNTTNAASFPQELRELKEKCEAQKRFRRASKQPVLPAFCVLRHSKAIDEVRTYQPDARDQANQDIAGFEYRYLAGSAFWKWLTGFESIEGLINDTSQIEVGEIRQARQECLERLQKEMADALKSRLLGNGIEHVLTLKKMMSKESNRSK